VVFIDEVEEIAAARNGGSVQTGVVNELLKGLVSFRERVGRLLICATNTVSALDPAFLRPGRFDYVLPVGPPDQVARHADIGHAARTVAQQTFERTVDTGRRCHASDEDYRAVITALRPTLIEPMLAAFTADIEAFART
jgi:SpoVK/Ycf46/Vps4 family AAA+-type ATPase